MRINVVNVAILVLTSVCLVPGGYAESLEWPYEIRTSEGTVILYTPQIESFEGNELVSRAAVSVTPPDEESPVFGVVRCKSVLNTDRDNDIAYLDDLEVLDVMFPEADATDVEKMSELLEYEFQGRSISVSIEQLTAELEAAREAEALTDDFNIDPPEIVVASTPTVLVVTEGDPILSPIEDTDVMRVVNTAYFMLLDTKTNTYFMRGGDHWYQAEEATGPYSPVGGVPDNIDALAIEAFEGYEEAEPVDIAEAPELVVRTNPAELILTDGPATYSPVSGTDLLYVSNTDSDVFLHVPDQTYYLLLAGRWYASAKGSNEVAYVRSDELPEDFANIPPGSVKETVLASVAGTQEAKDAVLNTYIPQTAEVKRGDAELEVVYDGEPEFVETEGSEVVYAANTPNAVFRVGPRYYCCYEGAWYESDSPNGPWITCISVPQVIYTVPPSCPHYYVRYCYVYSYNPNVVVVGYTPGYTGCYYYHGTVVYGTGYWYRPWYRRYCYSYPSTWGFGVRYNPWTESWGFAVGYRGPNGWVAWGKSSWTGNRWGAGGIWGGGSAAWWGGGRWGCGGYRDINVNINNRMARIGNGNNIYKRPANRDRAIHTRDRRPIGGNARPAVERPIAGSRDDRIAQRPAPRDAARPATRDAARPSVGDNARPTTRDVARPSVGDNARPTTRDVARPSVGDNARPTTRDVTRPSTGDVTRPTTREARPAPRDIGGITQTDRTARPNNVYSDRQGNVYKRDGNNWQTRDRGNWTSTPSTLDRSSLDRSYNSRQRGTYNTNQSRQRSYQSSPSRSNATSRGSFGGGGGGRSFGGGGGRGGGGGFRR